MKDCSLQIKITLDVPSDFSTAIDMARKIGFADGYAGGLVQGQIYERRACISCIASEHVGLSLSDETICAEDLAYNRALNDAINSINAQDARAADILHNIFVQSSEA
jgi:hypothetical protein